MQHFYDQISDFSEARLVFKAKPQSLLNPLKSPSEWNQEAVNPEEGIHGFIGDEKSSIGKAWQHPFRDAFREGVADLKELAKALISPVTIPLDITKATINSVSNAVSEVVPNVITRPFKIFGRAALAPIAFTINNTKRLTDLTVKLPASGVNVMGSYMMRPVMAVSGAVKSIPDKISKVGTKLEESATSAANSVRDRINKLKIPGIDGMAMRPMSAAA